MKKILITFLLCSVYRSQAQDTLIQLRTTGDSGIITNIGVFHKPYITIGKETAYTDTVLINRYFQILAKKVNAKNVVLVVEYPMVNVSKGIITEDSTNSIWVTQEMRNLGFKKWMAADTRTIRDSALYFNSRKFLLSFIEKYIQIKEDTTKDLLGFTNFSFKERISIPEKILE